MDSRISFLQTLASCPHGARKKDLPLSDREIDRMRQKLRVSGLVEYVDLGKGKRWHITEDGHKFLSAHKEPISAAEN
ncbi:hypothetical protein D2T29_12555 [Sinirhodobacter populi]|uniref:Winged helix-turn-helix domain-containing protein n=1 Tax=Paenirhodobacter populi TaxID=2306993 RepID=A0A443KCN7_9RHOB|nr:hypothetical protein [Sinirhodobacter populi]RWR30495.1 hypothetical protein D2T29_12555 [Sinirhodobacter populi]